jgi:hypothetical protein
MIAVSDAATVASRVRMRGRPVKGKASRVQIDCVRPMFEPRSQLMLALSIPSARRMLCQSRV